MKAHSIDLVRIYRKIYDAVTAGMDELDVEDFAIDYSPEMLRPAEAADQLRAMLAEMDADALGELLCNGLDGNEGDMVIRFCGNGHIIK